MVALPRGYSESLGPGDVVSRFEILQANQYAARMDLPIVCTLSETELRERRRTVLESIRETAINATPTPNGYSYSFKPTPEILARLTSLVDLERQCCQFLTFTIVVEPLKPIRLEVSGPPEARAMIADFFGN
jgi:hypothetical protein